MKTTGIRLTEEAMLLLVNAEAWIYDHRCGTCEYYTEGIFPGECPYFRACADGRRSCDGYKRDRLCEWVDYREELIEERRRFGAFSREVK